MEEVLVRRSRKRALNLLLKSDRTRSQLLQKLLTDGYPPEIAEQAVAYAESFGYIDDSRYARRYLDGPGGRKSRAAARMDLIRKGISSDLIDRILQETEAESEETEREKAVALARKRLGEPHRLDDKEYRRAYAYLARRGFFPFRHLLRPGRIQNHRILTPRLFRRGVLLFPAFFFCLTFQKNNNQIDKFVKTL